MKHKLNLMMNYPKEVKKSWHNSSTEEVLDFFVTSKVTGLSAGEVFKRGQRMGTNQNNIIPEPSVAYFKCTVLRDKKRQKVNNTNLVLGDIVILEKNAMVPADIRLIEVNNLTVDQSLLNGVSAPAYKNALSTPISSDDITKVKNMAYAGSFVLAGEARGVVGAIGPHTVAGKLGINKSWNKVPLRLKRKIKSFTNTGIVIQNFDILKQLKTINTVIINLPLLTDDYKELIRILSSKMGKNVIICSSLANTQKLNETVPGIVHLDKAQFKEKSNKALLEADYPLMSFDGVGQTDIIRYAKLLKIKSRSVLCIDNGQDSQIFSSDLITLTIADTATDRSMLEADIIIGDINSKQKFIKQIDKLLS